MINDLVKSIFYIVAMPGVEGEGNELGQFPEN